MRLESNWHRFQRHLDNNSVGNHWVSDVPSIWGEYFFFWRGKYMQPHFREVMRCMREPIRLGFFFYANDRISLDLIGKDARPLKRWHVANDSFSFTTCWIAGTVGRLPSSPMVGMMQRRKQSLLSSLGGKNAQKIREDGREIFSSQPVRGRSAGPEWGKPTWINWLKQGIWLLP